METQVVKVDISAIGIGQMVAFLIKFWIAAIITAALPGAVVAVFWFVVTMLTA